MDKLPGQKQKYSIRVLDPISGEKTIYTDSYEVRDGFLIFKGRRHIIHIPKERLVNIRENLD